MKGRITTAMQCRQNIPERKWSSLQNSSIPWPMTVVNISFNATIVPAGMTIPRCVVTDLSKGHLYTLPAPPAAKSSLLDSTSMHDGGRTKCSASAPRVLDTCTTFSAKLRMEVASVSGSIRGKGDLLCCGRCTITLVHLLVWGAVEVERRAQHTHNAIKQPIVTVNTAAATENVMRG